MAGVAGVPDDLVLPPEQTLIEAQRLLDTGLPFQAHEVLEAAWKSAASHERALWQGLAQLAVGMTHAMRGNAAGAVALLERGARRLAEGTGDAPYGIDVVGLIAWARAASRDVRLGGGVPVPPRLQG